MCGRKKGVYFYFKFRKVQRHFYLIQATNYPDFGMVPENINYYFKMLNLHWFTVGYKLKIQSKLGRQEKCVFLAFSVQLNPKQLIIDPIHEL